jgi:hypothetical protein
MFVLGMTGQGTVDRGMSQLNRNGSRNARELAGAWRSAGKEITAIGGTLRNVAIMAGGAGAMRAVIADVAEFERGLTEMRITGELTARETGNIRKQILGMARLDLQLPEDQLAAFQQMVAAGIDPRQAINGMHDINRAATASFSDVRDIAGTSIDLLQKMDIAPENLGRAFDIMAKGGKAGKFELKDMARYFPQVASDMQRFGIVNERGVAQMTAMLQIARRGTAMPSEAANNMQNFFGHITQYRGAFKKLGINIWEFIDPKDGKIRADKNIDDFFKEIIRKSKGSVAALEVAGIRDVQAKAFIQQMMQNWDDRVVNGKEVKGYKTILDESLNSKGTIDEDFDTAKNTTWGKFKDAVIAKNNAMKSGASSAVAEKGAELLGWAVDNPLKTAGLLYGGYRGYKAIRNRMGGGGLSGAAGGMGGAGTPIPVYVVNKHLSMLPGKGGWGFPEGAEGAKTAAKRAATLRAAGLGRLATMARLGATLAGSVGAAGAGVTAGAAVGTFAAAYGAGTWIERRFIKGAIGDALYDIIHPEDRPEKDKTNINLQLNIDANGRPVTQTDMGTTVNVTPRGSFFPFMTAH